MNGQSKRPNKAERKAAKKAYKNSQTPFGLLRGRVMKPLLCFLGLTLLGYLLRGLEELDQFVPHKEVYSVMLFLGGTLILYWVYRRFHSAPKNEQAAFGWHRLAGLGIIEVFFALAGLSVMFFSIWHFFNPLNFNDTLNLVIMILVFEAVQFIMLIAAGFLFALAIDGWRSGERWKIIYALIGLLTFLMFVGICWVTTLSIFPGASGLQILFVLACAAVTLGLIIYFFLVPAWRKDEQTF